MKDSKDYFVANIVTNEEMQCNGYVDFLLRNMKERISNEILAIVSDGNEYAIKMLPEQRIEKTDMMSVEVRQGISVKELVRCGDCRRAIPFSVAGNRDAFCHCDLFDATMTRKDFCSYGERKEKTDE